MPVGFVFPDDFGPHPDYQTEWWYYTGNLEAGTGERFGYQLTFFRRAIVPPDERVARESEWGSDQVYMAHFAVSDVENREHHAFERFSRGAAGLAGAQAEPYHVWLEDWEVIQIGEDRYQLKAGQNGVELNLTLLDTKGPIAQGVEGYSQKGPEAGNASYYYSQTRLETNGTVVTPGGGYTVSGLSWKDHEYSTSALLEGQVGWDWFSIQLDDLSELMVFQIRREDGSIDPFSSGTWMSPDGQAVILSRDDFTIEALETWRSPHSDGRYPSRWRITVPDLGLSLNVEPYFADQEMNVSYSYWEGAVAVSGEREGRAVQGSGYVEMTGYAGSFEGEF
jgi:predicted secreted hydrolase